MAIEPVVILASGGLDSTVTAAIAKAEGYSLNFLTIDYGQRHLIEIACAQKVAACILDRALAALLGDLSDRGLLEETLVVLATEFGRTPNINQNAGRDHWTFCYSVLLAGAGIRGGTVYGASDAQAAYVKDNPVSPADICATIYACLGIDPEMQIPDSTGQPVRIGLGPPCDRRCR